MAGVPQICFLHDQEKLGFKFGANRWRSLDGERLYTWDHLHEHIEVFDNRGGHLGVLDAITGIKIGDPVKGRKIDV
jgi:hypothetical protein